MIRIACSGNSITEGVESGVAVPYPALLQTRLGSEFRVTNEGHSGNTTQQLLVRLPNIVIEEDETTTVLIIMEGTNDIAVHGLTGAQAAANLATYVAAARQTWDHVWVCTTTLRAEIQAQIDDYNAIIRADLSTYGDVLIDMAANEALQSDSEYFDGLHPNQSGHHHMMREVFRSTRDALAEFSVTVCNANTYRLFAHQHILTGAVGLEDSVDENGRVSLSPVT